MEIFLFNYFQVEFCKQIQFDIIYIYITHYIKIYIGHSAFLKIVLNILSKHQRLTQRNTDTFYHQISTANTQKHVHNQKEVAMDQTDALLNALITAKNIIKGVPKSMENKTLSTTVKIKKQITNTRLQSPTFPCYA